MLDIFVLQYSNKEACESKDDSESQLLLQSMYHTDRHINGLV
jgi:hypothetical protein